MLIGAPREHTNLSTVVEGPRTVLAAAHAKARRDGYRGPRQVAAEPADPVNFGEPVWRDLGGGNPRPSAPPGNLTRAARGYAADVQRETHERPADAASVESGGRGRGGPAV
ncbi:hypothetical protein GCM10009780_06880 [Actinomadura alba]